MKKIFSLVAVAFCFCALTTTLVSCGDDKKDEPTPPSGPTGIVGKWVGDFPAQPDDPNFLMWRYAHKLIYVINPDNTFEITESACWYDTDPSVAEYDMPSIPAIDPIRPTGAYLGERITHRIAGTYQLGENNKITITTTKEAWGGDDNFDMQDVTTPYVETFDYTINGNKLKIGDGSVVAVSPHNLIAYGELTWQEQN